MNRSIRSLVAATALVCSIGGILCLAPAMNQRQPADLAMISGTVLDAQSMRPLPGVKVAWRSQTSTSDSHGRYELRLPPGVREVSFTDRDRPSVRKIVIIREPGAQVRQDVLLPDSRGVRRKVLALDRSSRIGQSGKDLDSDVSGDSSISLADEYGNDDEVLTLHGGKMRVHSPVWLGPTTVAFAKQGVVHHTENTGVFQYQSDSGNIRQLVSGIAAQFLSKLRQRDALAVADQKNVYVMDSLSDPSSVRRIFSLAANRGFLLSVAWGPDDRIYFTIDDSIPIGDDRYRSKSRIASVKPDGTDLQADWASDSQYSYRYPTVSDSAHIVFCRFALDGTQQTLWSRNLRTGKAQPIADPALRAVHVDSARVYYIYSKDLHLREMKSGTDWVIVNSVREADYLRH